MLDIQYTKDALNDFGKQVVSRSKANLTRGKKNVFGDLYKSLGYTFKVSPNSFGMYFTMEDYGVFQDEGVSGTKKKYKTPHSFTNKQPPSEPIARWAKARNIRLRDEKGRFKKGSYKTIGFIIARSIKEKGIKPSLFFTKPFAAAFKKLPEDLIESFALDIEEFLENTRDVN